MSTRGAAQKTAVVIIDLQKNVLANAHDAAGVVERTARLVERAREAGSPVVWVQHDDADMPLGTPGWQLADGLTPADGEKLIQKQWSDSFAETDLEEFLDACGATRLVIAGAQTDFCIRNTWHSALQRGYDTVLVEDCHTTEDGGFDGHALPAETIIQYTNRYAYFGSNYPGRSGTSAAHDEVVLNP